MRIVVTGGLGHIGSALLRNLPKKTEVVILDNLLTQRYSSLFSLPKGISYTFIEADIRTADITSYLKGADVVVHLAAVTNAEASHDRQKETEEVNLDGLKRVADACLKAKVKILFPSTTSVYGTADNVVDENSKNLKPQSPYADSKLAAESYLKSLKAKGLKFVICRFGTIFGFSVGMRFHTAVNKFTWQAVNGIPVTVWRTAWKQKRPYLDLRDCVSAINFILKENIFDGEIYNVLTQNFTVEDIVGAIKGFVPKLEVKYVDSAIMNQFSYNVDDSKFKKLGWKPKGNLKRGIGETVELLKGIMNNK